MADRPAVLVTGGNSGIGFECARELARGGWRVLIASRDRDATARAVARIVAEYGGDAIDGRHLDLGSFDSIRRLAAEIEAEDLPLRALVCNAGLQVTSGPRLSSDGYEITFAVNHLGHFLLTNLLLRRLLSNPPARIVVVASGVHDPKQKTGMPKAAVTDLETLAATGGPRRGEFNGRLAYVNSKLCNLWFVYELVRRIDASQRPPAASLLTVNGYDPGLVPGSGLGRDYPAALQLIWHRVLPGVARVLTRFVPTVNPAPKSGRALARLVSEPAFAAVTGKYFPSHSRWQAAASSDLSYDVERARELWDASVRMARLTPSDSPLAGA